MGIEIEHKYLVTDSSYRDMAVRKALISQGYLSRDPERTVRVRIIDDSAFITVKGVTNGAVRKEFEYPVPVEDARELLSLCLPGIISKYRYYVPFGGFIWEVDEFDGHLKGQVTAEIEVPSPDTNYPLPPFIGKNVTGNPGYYNSNL